MSGNILGVVGIFAIAITAQTAGRIDHGMVQKGKSHNLQVAPEPTPTPSVAVRSISEKGVSGGSPPKSPPPRKPCKNCVKF